MSKEPFKVISDDQPVSQDEMAKLLSIAVAERNRNIGNGIKKKTYLSDIWGEFERRSSRGEKNFMITFILPSGKKPDPKDIKKAEVSIQVSLRKNKNDMRVKWSQEKEAFLFMSTFLYDKFFHGSTSGRPVTKK